MAADDENVRAIVAQAPLIDTSVEGESTFNGAAWAAQLVLTGWVDLGLLSALGCEPVLLAAITRAITASSR